MAGRDIRARPDIRWAAVGAGRLTLWHRPAKRDIEQLASIGCDRVVTLLSAREGGEEVGRAIGQAGVKWLWLPMPNADTPAGELRRALEEGLAEISRALDGGESVLIHCSAGIHRTGMVGYALLRWRGSTREEAVEKIGEMRVQTQQGMRPQDFLWGDDLDNRPG